MTKVYFHNSSLNYVFVSTKEPGEIVLDHFGRKFFSFPDIDLDEYCKEITLKKFNKSYMGMLEVFQRVFGDYETEE